MSKHKSIRHDKTCLNCQHVVEARYCSNCGQENIEVRQSFWHLFVHFFEDFTHYEGSFWKTFQYLITKPGKLTKDYLSGKRQSFLNPIKLYIFTSFVTFLILALLPSEEMSSNNDDNLVMDVKFTPNQSQLNSKINVDSVVILEKIKEEIRKTKALHESGIIDKKQSDKIIEELTKTVVDGRNNNIFNTEYSRVKELDSTQIASKNTAYTSFEYFFYKKYLKTIENKTRKEIITEWKEGMFKNLPKVLFIYMPIFAFLLWLFHSKRRWLYFDHGIFTLHYFSFLLLMILIQSIIGSITLNLGSFGALINSLCSFVGGIWMFYYFFPAHHRFYGGSRWMTVFKGIVFMILNFILLLFLLIAYMGINILMIH